MKNSSASREYTNPASTTGKASRHGQRASRNTTVATSANDAARNSVLHSIRASVAGWNSLVYADAYGPNVKTISRPNTRPWATAWFMPSIHEWSRPEAGSTGANGTNSATAVSTMASGKIPLPAARSRAVAASRIDADIVRDPAG